MLMRLQQMLLPRVWLAFGCLMLSGVVELVPAGWAEERTPVSVQPLTLEQLFVKREFDGAGGPDLRWSRKSSTYFTWETAASGPGRDLVRHDPATGATSIAVKGAALVPAGATDPLSVEGYEFSADESRLLIFTKSRRVWRMNTRGDYWVLDIEKGELKQLGGEAPASSLMFAKFSPDGTRVAYVREGNLFVQEVATQKITQLTHDDGRTVINGTGDWVNEEELGIRDAYRWSPDGQQLLVWQFDQTGVGLFHLMNNVEGLTPSIQTFAYPKVGTTNSATRLGVVAAAGGPVRWIELPGDPREHYLPRAEWIPDGSGILLQRFNRLQTELTVWKTDARGAAAKVILTETDAAWLENDHPLRWLSDGREFLWVSERTGWRQLYRASVAGGELVPITRGEFDVIEVEGVDQRRGWLYYAAAPESATQRACFRISLDGQRQQRLSPIDRRGWHRCDYSLEADWGVHVFSTATTPPVVELIRAEDFNVIKTFTDNRALGERLAQVRKPELEFFQVEVSPGVTLDGWMIKPPNYGAAGERYPLLMYVYGEPHGQTVQDSWQGAGGMWHWLLAEHGIVVASVDNRGTNVPKGRAWRKVVHRQIGILASQEQATAVRQILQRWPAIDPARVGCWGWSGGGSMSLNALFRYPELYRMAIAIAPVPDQQLYDTIYQERYMGLPTDNAAGYRDGSPITFADRMRGELLLIHGTGDDNCHYQGTERLLNRLIAAEKRVTVLPYPNRSHDLHEGENTERHLRRSMTAFVDDHLLHPRETFGFAVAAPVVEEPTRRPTLQFYNGWDAAAEVFWLKSPTERVPQATIEPGRQSVVTTTLGHRFAVVNRNTKEELIVTSEVPIQAVRAGGLPVFYTQQVLAEGFPIVGSAQVSPFALKEAAYLVNQMLARRPDVRRAMVQSGTRLCIIGHAEYTTDLPEWVWLADEPVPGFERLPARDFYDARARGMGGSETDPYCSCGEENLLAYEGDPYATENILIHELAHNIHLRGMNNLDPTFDTRVQAAYKSAMAAGLWRGKYASVNHHEYFAEGVQSWFDNNRENDHDHNHVNTRVELIEYDPGLAALCREVFGDTEFRYTKPTQRLTGHMEGYDPQRAPKFEFPPRLNEARRLIRASAQKRNDDANPAKP